MKVLRSIRNYICYCGIEKDEYDAVKKDAYVSNFGVWRVLHVLMAAIFGFLFISSLFSELMSINRVFYLTALVYSAVDAYLFFFVLKKDSIVPQFLIYLSIILLFLFGCLITRNKPDSPSVTFIVFLLITPLFMIDKPYFMTLVISISTVVFLVWMRGVKEYAVWQIDLINVVTFAVVAIFLHIIANSIRIREFVLRRKINIQKDTDDLTGLKNKGALTREINGYLANGATNRGILFMLDIDKFKAINDTYGHDVGDDVIRQLGEFLGRKFTAGEIVGRFGGDEFVVFIPGTDDPEDARRVAGEIVSGASGAIALPDPARKVAMSIGIALYHGAEKNYSEILKKADLALYTAKGDRENRFCLSE